MLVVQLHGGGDNSLFLLQILAEVPDKQIIIAAGEGAKAILSVIRYLEKRR